MIIPREYRLSWLLSSWSVRQVFPTESCSAFSHTWYSRSLRVKSRVSPPPCGWLPRFSARVSLSRCWSECFPGIWHYMFPQTEKTVKIGRYVSLDRWHRFHCYEACGDGSLDVTDQGITAEKVPDFRDFRISADIQIAHSECRMCAREHIFAWKDRRE